MLYNLERQEITYIPHKSDYDLWRSRLPDEDFTAIMTELERVLDQGKVHVSSFVPGSDWTGTVYAPIYEVACEEDETFSAYFFGLLMWVAVMNHPEAWSFIKYNDRDIQGMTYFKIQLPGDPAELSF